MAKSHPTRSCSFPGCSRQLSARGYCNTHYRQARTGRELTPLPELPLRPCAYYDCGRQQYAHGLCNQHRAMELAGKGLRPIQPLPGSPAERLYASVEKTEKCWVWTGFLKPEGYGHIGVAGRTVLVHRLAWELERGVIPAGIEVDHRCRNRACVRVEHLQLVTHKLNQENASGASRNSTTGVLGVSWRKDNCKYRVRVMHNLRSYSGGSFDNIEDAERAAIALRSKLFTNNLKDRGLS